MTDNFSYDLAFSRNVGWVTPQEQQVLRSKRVAIAGMGGVGGVHLLTLARLGIGAFHIADFDVFDLVNFNRQVGATLSTLGKPKTDTLASLARDINPEADIKVFAKGIDSSNLASFLSDVDLYVDGLDFFAFSPRQLVFAACAEYGIPAITAAPLGMGAALLNFLPGKMTFEEYFRWGDLPEQEKALRFLLGLAPAGLHGKYLVDPSSINLQERRGPSTIMGCQLCAGVAATEALKILLNRGKVLAAPHGLHFDAYRNKMAHTWRPGGNANPLQKLALSIGRRRLMQQTQPKPEPSPPPSLKPIEQILNMARWAPSGDNTQPWRFEVIGEHHAVVHGFDTRDHCVYDLDGHASQISHGALLETVAVAATAHGFRTTVERRPDSLENKPTFDIHFEPDDAIGPDPLIPYIPYRTVQRRPMSMRRLSLRQKHALEAAVGAGYRVLWLESAKDRLRAALLMFRNAKLRLTLPEAYQVHRDIIEWNARFSSDRLPDQAIGLDPVALGLMRWAMKSWGRVEFLNKYLAGTLMPRVQLDLIPGIACSAHFAIVAQNTPATAEDYTVAGRRVQRFWLTAAKTGLFIQPEITPLVFARYVREGTTFSQKDGALEQAEKLSLQLQQLLSAADAAHVVFMGRIGTGPAPSARSLRLPLSDLLER
jgi:molybdopterin/thiamine biosynthesis adenylyltransferase